MARKRAGPSKAPDAMMTAAAFAGDFTVRRTTATTGISSAVPVPTKAEIAKNAIRSGPRSATVTEKALGYECHGDPNDANRFVASMINVVEMTIDANVRDNTTHSPMS